MTTESQQLKEQEHFIPLSLTTTNSAIVSNADKLGDHVRMEVVEDLIGDKSNIRPPEYPVFTNKDDEIASLRKRLEAALRITNEYDQLIRHMNAGGDFYKFMTNLPPVSISDSPD